jgi:hypothetical protein
VLERFGFVAAAVEPTVPQLATPLRLAERWLLGCSTVLTLGARALRCLPLCRLLRLQLPLLLLKVLLQWLVEEIETAADS